jgi:hypothetical protein
MSKPIIISFVLWFVFSNGSGQILRPVSNESEDILSDKSRQALQKLRENTWVRDVRIADFGNLMTEHSNNELNFSVPGYRKLRIQARTTKFEYTSENQYNYLGEIGDGYVLFGKKSGEIFGQINTGDRVIGINHLEANKVVLFDYDIDKLRIGSCALPNESHDKLPSGRIRDNSPNTLGPRPGPAVEHLVDPVVRVLVLYTPAAAAFGVSITQTVNTALQQYSAARYNSNVTTQVYLAGIVSFDVVEDQTGETGGIRAENTVNQLAQNLAAQTLRDSYDADVVIMLTNGNFSDPYQVTQGIVAGIGPSESMAYAVVQIAAATANYTFIHELGHLFGCRHQNDLLGPYPDSKPHTWSLGWGPWTNHYSTLLWSPPNTTRTLNFSNPDTYSHGQRTGVYGERNNARIMSENGWILQGFQDSDPQIPMSVAVSGPDYAAFGEPLHFVPQINQPGIEPYSYNWFSTAGPPGSGPSYFVTMPETSSMTVYLTVTDINSQTANTSKNVYWNGLSNSLLKDEQLKETLISDSDLLAPLVHPNPASSEFTISFPKSKAGVAKVLVADAKGRQLRQIDVVLRSNSITQENVDISELPTGTYFVTLVIDQQLATQRLVKRK